VSNFRIFLHPKIAAFSSAPAGAERIQGGVMKAIRVHEKGGPEVLAYEDAPKPALRAGDALVRVYASAITKDELTWDPTYETEKRELRTPSILGHEFSGVVEEIANDVTSVKVNDEVYGLPSFYRDGSAAEFVAVHADDLAPKPKSLDHVQAAAVPLAALTAWQALFSHAGLTRGQRVLIHGGAGGVGSFAVQLASWAGAHVFTTAAANNHDFLGQLGAHEVIDYSQIRFEERVSDVDAVLDTIGGDTLERSYGVVRQGGTLVSVVDEPSKEKSKAVGIKSLFFIVEPNRTQLEEIGRLIDTGRLRVFVDTVLPLEQAREAFEQGLKGHSRGKIVLRVAEQAARTAR
jgi:NADPH:quinone reductase-like Zn-dependent oxidoreductase